MTPHGTPAGTLTLSAALAAWLDARDGAGALAAMARVPRADCPAFARLGPDLARRFLVSPEEAAKLLQEVAPDDAG